MSFLRADERTALLTRVTTLFRAVPDFPKPDVVFRDITPVLQAPDGFKAVSTLMADALWSVCVTTQDEEPRYQIGADLVAGVESRGFILAAMLAQSFDLGFTMVRKPGKLPCPTISETYGKEYGRDVVHMHTDGVLPGQRVALVDDLIATGGSLLAAARLIRRLGGEVVSCLCLVELDGLGGRDKLETEGLRVDSVLRF